MTACLKREYFFGPFIFVVALLVYANSLGNGFVGDDRSVILNNPLFQGSLLSLFNTIDTIGDFLLPYYRPLTYMTFWADGRLHGFNPFFIRLFNVLLHSANAYLFYFFTLKIINKTNFALLAGLLFAVHPLNTEGVDFNAGGRNTMLACFFVLLTYLVHRSSIIRNNMYIAHIAGLCMMAGLFSKESALMVFPFIMVLEYLHLREHPVHQRLRSIIRLLPHVLAIVLYLFMRWQTLSKLGIQTGILPSIGTSTIKFMYVIPDLSARLLDNIYILPRYLLTVIWPTALSPVYMVPDDLNLLALPLLAGWVCIVILLAWLLTRGRSNTTLFGLAWLLLFWLPVSGIFWFGSAPLADRYLYLPALGLWIIIADQACQLIGNNITASRYFTISATFALFVLAGLTVRRNMDWRSNMTLFSRVVEQYPDNIQGHMGLGNAYFTRRVGNDILLAEREFERVLDLDPTAMLQPHIKLGHIKLDRDDLDGALHHYNEALGIYPYDKEARFNRAITYEKMGKLKDALVDYQFFLTTPGRNNIPGSRQRAEKSLQELSPLVDISK
jgi:hypothetical protein